jgi:hypothetical protein
MLSHNETRKMAIKSHSNVKPKHEVLAYQYLKKNGQDLPVLHNKKLPVPSRYESIGTKRSQEVKAKITCEKTEESQKNVLLLQIR